MRELQLSLLLQNSEAPLLNFGQSQYFPNVGKYCALSLSRARFAGARFYRDFIPPAGAYR